MTIPLYLQVKGKPLTSSVAETPTEQDIPKFHVISDTNVEVNDKTYEFDQIFTSENGTHSKSIINHHHESNPSSSSQCWLFMGPTNSGKTTSLYNVLLDKLHILTESKSICFITAFEIIDNNKKYIIDLMGGNHNKVRSNHINFENQLMKERFDSKAQLKQIFNSRLTKRTAFNSNSSRSVLIVTLYYNNTRSTFIDFMGNEEFSTSSNVFANLNLSSISQLILSNANKSLIGRSSNFITNFIFKKHHHTHTPHNLKIVLHLDLYGNEKLIKSTLNNVFQMIHKFNTIVKDGESQEQVQDQPESQSIKKRKLPHYAQPTMSSQSPIRKKRVVTAAVKTNGPVKMAKILTYDDLKKSFHSLKHEYHELTTQVQSINTLVQPDQPDQSQATTNFMDLLKTNITNVLDINANQSQQYSELLNQYNHLTETHHLKVSQYEDNIQELNKSIESHELKIDTLQLDLNDKLPLLDQLKQDTNAKQCQIDQLHQDRNNDQTTIQQLKLDMTAKQTQIEQLKKDTNNNQIVIDQLNEEFKAKQQQIDQLQQDASTNVEIVGQLKLEIFAKQQQIDSLNQTMVGNHDLIDQFNDDIKHKQELITQLTQQLDAKQALITKCETDTTTSNQQIDHLNQIILDKQIEIDQLAQNVIQLNQELINKQQIIDQQIIKNQELSTHLSALNAQTVNKDDLISQLTTQAETKDQLISQLTSQAETKDHLITQLKSQVVQLNQQLDTTDGKVKQLNQTLELKNADIAKLQQQQQQQQVPSYDVPLINSDNLMMSVFPSLKSNTNFDPTTEMFHDKENTPVTEIIDLDDSTPSPALNSSPTKSASTKKKNHQHKSNHSNVLHNSSNYKSLVGKQLKKKNSGHKKSSPTKSPKVSTNNFGTLVQSQF